MSSALKERNFDNAKSNYVKSAELENNPIEKAKTYYTLATSLYSNEPQKSKEYLKNQLILTLKMVELIYILLNCMLIMPLNVQQTILTRK